MNYENYIKKCKEDDEWYEKHWVFGIPRDIYYWCYRNLRVLDWYREIKYWFQRAFRGYDDRRWWGLGDNLGKDIVRDLKIFRNANRAGVPSEFCESHDDKELTIANKKWNDILDKMINGFEQLIDEGIDTQNWKDYYINKIITYEEFLKIENERISKAKEDAKLFIDYFLNLWD
jgi:hypothetical protein